MLPAAFLSLPLLAVKRTRERPPAHRCEEQARVRIEDTGAYGCPCQVPGNAEIAPRPPVRAAEGLR